METQTKTKVLACHNKHKRVDKETIEIIETTREMTNNKNRGRAQKTIGESLLILY